MVHTTVPPARTTTLPAGVPSKCGATRTLSRSVCSEPYFTVAAESDSAVAVAAFETFRSAVDFDDLNPLSPPYEALNWTVPGAYFAVFTLHEPLPPLSVITQTTLPPALTVTAPTGVRLLAVGCDPPDEQPAMPSARQTKAARRTRDRWRIGSYPYAPPRCATTTSV